MQDTTWRGQYNHTQEELEKFNPEKQQRVFNISHSMDHIQPLLTEHLPVLLPHQPEDCDEKVEQVDPTPSPWQPL